MGPTQWTIRSVVNQKYIRVETLPGDRTCLVGLDAPHFWDIKTIPYGLDPPSGLTGKYMFLLN